MSTAVWPTACPLQAVRRGDRWSRWAGYSIDIDSDLVDSAVARG